MELIRGPKWYFVIYHFWTSYEIQKGCRNFDQQEVPLSKDNFDDDNSWLIRDTMEEEIRQATNKINPLKTLGPYGMHVIFTKNAAHTLQEHLSHV